MLVMNYSQARQNFSSFLDSAKENGMAIIQRADGSKFKVIPWDDSEVQDSPFNELFQYSKTINSKLNDISMKDIINMIHEDQDERASKQLRLSSGKKASNFFNILNKK